MTDLSLATPYLTPSELRIGGVLKQVAEDFLVEEIPAYQPTGEGEHLFLWVEKRNLDAESLVQVLARALGVARGDIGVAGMKDRVAVTRQFVSVPIAAEPALAGLAEDRVTVLSAERHPHKLRTGHLKGNRFDILVRNVEPQAAEIAASIAAALPAGAPNYFGEQRFGNAHSNLHLGLALLTGEKTPRQLPRQRRRFLLRLALSAAQSYLFNAVLASRIDDGLIDRVHVGDVMQVTETGGLFCVDDAEREQQRYDSGEVALCGPIFGPQTVATRGAPAERERAVLEETQLSPDDFERFSRLTRGSRRPFCVRQQDLRVLDEEAGLRFQFTLPRGAYATSFLAEFMKSRPPI